jgi:hypothetical protein
VIARRNRLAGSFFGSVKPVFPARYPDDLAKAQLDYSQAATAEIIEKAHEAVSWIETQLSR